MRRLLLLPAMSLFLCSQIIQAEAPLPVRVDSGYDARNPYYVKYCSVTQLAPKDAHGKKGGVPGHGLFYLKGVCRAPEVGPSGLKLCGADADLNNPNTGVGISVDRGLKNASFLVVPTLGLFLGIDFSTGRLFDEKTKTSIVKNVVKSGLFKGIEFRTTIVPETVKPEDRERFIARYIFGTDYALSMSRNLYCVNVPVTKDMMSIMVDHLNERNAFYANQDNGYEWNVIYDNCAHAAINTLAAIGVVPPKKVNQSFFAQLANLAQPANAFLDIHEAVNEKDIDVNAYYNDKTRREIFRRYRWIGQQPDALLEFIPVHGYNGVYDDTDVMKIFGDFLSEHSKKLRAVPRNPRFTAEKSGSTVANRQFFIEKYRRGIEIAKRRADENVHNHDYLLFAMQFEEFLKEKLEALQDQTVSFAGRP